MLGRDLPPQNATGVNSYCLACCRHSGSRTHFAGATNLYNSKMENSNRRLNSFAGHVRHCECCWNNRLRHRFTQSKFDVSRSGRRLPGIRNFLAVPCLLLPCAALAVGFALEQQSASNAGYAFAGAARAEDASAMFSNPAALSGVPGNQAVLGTHAIYGSASTGWGFFCD